MNKNGQGEVFNILILVGVFLTFIFLIVVGGQIFFAIYDVGQAEIDIDNTALENTQENLDEAVENITEHFFIEKVVGLILSALAGGTAVLVGFIALGSENTTTKIVGFFAVATGIVVILTGIFSLFG